MRVGGALAVRDLSPATGTWRDQVTESHHALWRDLGCHVKCDFLMSSCTLVVS
jgi:hypothetical protein